MEKIPPMYNTPNEKYAAAGVSTYYYYYPTKDSLPPTTFPPPPFSNYQVEYWSGRGYCRKRQLQPANSFS